MKGTLATEQPNEPQNKQMPQKRIKDRLKETSTKDFAKG